MEKNDIVTVVTISGEYVGKLSDNDGGQITLSDPRMILSNPETGQMGFAKGIAVTGVENPKEVTFISVVFVTPANATVSTAWQEATSQIVTPNKPTLVK